MFPLRQDSKSSSEKLHQVQARLPPDSSFRISFPQKIIHYYYVGLTEVQGTALVGESEDVNAGPFWGFVPNISPLT